MKYLITIIFSFLFLSTQILAKEKGALFLGKIVKTKKEINGSQYFITYETKDKTLAYPILNPDQKIKNMTGKMVRIWGKTEFKRAKYKESKYIMYFDISKADVLKLSDIGLKEQAYDDEQLDTFAKNFSSKPDGKRKTDGEGLEISDTAANTAIFVGGAILAAEVLKAFAGSN